MPRFVVHWAAVPALILSVLLLSSAGAPRSALIQQVLVAAFAISASVIAARARRASRPPMGHWLALTLAACLFLPLLFGAGAGVHRWLPLGGILLYVAPVVLPLSLFLIGASSGASTIYVLSTTMMAAALLFQPDAAQLSAFAVAMSTILVNSPWRFPLRLGLFALILCCAVAAWRVPDPLTPVRYVEGVFRLAADVSTFALLAAVVSAALPVLGLVWFARSTRCISPLAVAAYYTTLFALAPLQVTPVPLLGFGSGPILGYFLIASIISSSGGDLQALPSPVQFCADQIGDQKRESAPGSGLAARPEGLERIRRTCQPWESERIFHQHGSNSF